MKKYTLAGMFILLLANVQAFGNEGIYTNNSILFIIFLETIFVIMVAAKLYSFINITKKNPVFVLFYFVIALLLFNSIINLLYFLSNRMGWAIGYLPVYFLDRLNILIILVIIFWGFRKFNAMLRTKTK